MGTTDPEPAREPSIPEPYATFASLISDTSQGSTALITLLILELVRSGALDKGRMVESLRNFASPDVGVSDHIKSMFRLVADMVETNAVVVPTENPTTEV